MAYMIPEKPRDFDPNSKEDIMFDALSTLSDDYYVFHSFSIINVKNNVMYENEIDFVIFNPDKGIICLEAKAGQVKYSNGCWRYGDDTPMKHGGPYNQADVNKWKLIKYIEDKGLSFLIEKCKFLHAVWFPQISREKLNQIKFPSESDRNITLTKEALDNINEYIDKIFSIKLPNSVENNMTKSDIQLMLNNILAPCFQVVSIADSKISHNKYVFKKLLKEQVALLDYLEEQNSAVINGLAGTGKTIMAITKAQMNASKKEKVLFLCYNYYLKEHLQEMYNDEMIDFFTIDGLACKMCNTKEANYEIFKDILYDMFVNKSFPYKHIVIDEGQDFGREIIGESEIIEYLKLNVLETDIDGNSFYLFYDKNQLVQSDRLPNYINDADCKLTLYKNCRNTENIAITSSRFLNIEKNPKLFEGSIVGENPNMYFEESVENTVNTLNRIIDNNMNEGYKDIQILTCKTEETSIISRECSTGVYSYKKIPFTTCRKFKGLEADVVIIVDMDMETFSEEYEKIIYVGTSRARFKLEMICNLSESDCDELLKKLNMYTSNNYNKKLATAYNSIYKK